ncbi:MAG TPA: ABC transporter permease [Microlunatus sp.]|nr:ABC transporter permease [Microlunatus sp.]
MSTDQITGAGLDDVSTNAAPDAVVADSKVGEISQTQLMIRRFKQSKLAIIALFILALLYLTAIFAPFLATNDPVAVDQAYKYAAPTPLTWSGGPAMCTVTQEIDPVNISTTYVKDCSNPIPLQFLGQGFEYKFLGLIPTNRHLIVAPEGEAKLLFFGADGNGRDIYSRTLYGGRVSLTIGVLGVAIATVLGSIMGTWSGYAGGMTDNIIQRVIEIIQSIPTLPLWATMAAVLPQDISVTERFFLMSIILSLVAWTGLARQLRGKVMGYARSDYVSAAKSAGAKAPRIITTHLLPNSASHIVAVAMLAIPAAIIAETTLSFLGIGMTEPAISWGVLLKDASRIDVLQQYPWILLPAVFVVVAITCFQLLGDGVRDAVDPYS